MELNSLESFSAENEETLRKGVDLLRKLKEAGVLDTLIHISEPEVIEGLSFLFLNEGTLRLLDHSDEILKTLGGIDHEAIEGLGKIIDLLKVLNKTGILDALNDILKPEMIDRLSRFMINKGFLRLLDRLDVLLDMLGEIHYEEVERTIPLLNNVIKAVPEEAERVSLLGLMRKLRDEDVQRGVGVITEILKAIGRTYKR